MKIKITMNFRVDLPYGINKEMYQFIDELMTSKILLGRRINNDRYFIHDKKEERL